MPAIYVIDQNVMQRPTLPEFIAAHPNAHFALPDTSLVEMCKSEQWEHTFRRNLAPLVPVVSRCLMSLSVQEAMELEVKHRTSAEGRLLSTQFRPLLRGAIVGSQLPDGNKTMRQIKDEIDHVRKELKDNDLMHPSSEARFRAALTRYGRKSPPRTSRHAGMLQLGESHALLSRWESETASTKPTCKTSASLSRSPLGSNGRSA